MVLQLEQRLVQNVQDPAGLWQYEGGQVISEGAHVANYSSAKRIMREATPNQNAATLSMTIFFLGSSPPENITVQGVHDFDSGRQIGSVSAASPSQAAYIGRSFVREGEEVTLR